MEPKQLSIDGRETPWDKIVIPHVSTRREDFLRGLFASWLAPDGKPTKAQRSLAEKAARAAVEVLNVPNA